MNQNPNEIVDSKPGICPECGSDNSEADTPEFTSDYQCEQAMHCPDCGCYWYEKYVFESKLVAIHGRTRTAGRNFLYTVGEVFRHDGKTFRCSADSRGIVQYRLIDAPIEDMMYRASDGKLYQYLCDPERYDTRVCACESGNLTCDAIQQALFGRDCVKGEIWVPVDEGK